MELQGRELCSAAHPGGWAAAGRSGAGEGAVVTAVSTREWGPLLALYWCSRQAGRGAQLCPAAALGGEGVPALPALLE